MPIDPARATTLSDARLQLHHAAQLATALGISYLEPKADDSHTNLEWLSSLRALASNRVRAAAGGVRVGLVIRDLALVVLRDGAVTATRALTGETNDAAASWVRNQLAALGLDGNRYSLRRHYELPPHAVAAGAAYDADTRDLEQLAFAFGDAHDALEFIRRDRGGTDVRCWPHHFDVATLLTPRTGASVGAGMEPGDGSYDEPYYYVNAYPQPDATRLVAALGGGGHWHTHEWIGAVLPASRLSADGGAQRAQIAAFLTSAVDACTALVR